MLAVVKMLFEHMFFFFLLKISVKKVCCCFPIHTLNECQDSIYLSEFTCDFWISKECMLAVGGNTEMHRVQNEFIHYPMCAYPVYKTSNLTCIEHVFNTFKISDRKGIC